MDYEQFFSSLPGQLLCVGIIIIFFAAIFFMTRKEKLSTKAITLSALLIALAFVSNNFLPRWRLPNGGSVTLFSMLFLYLIGYTMGLKVGIVGGMTYGVLDLLFSASAYYPLQILLDFPLAFGAIGLGAILRDKKFGLQSGYVFGIFMRFVMSFLSGYFFFAEYTPEGYSPVMWAIVYNGTYILIEGIATLVLMSIPA
ncbi:MAG: proton-coupled thiamine transporter YuaJ, partial [Anaerofustis stercorihominis]|nr:proton-coupled thiamine transporter YuaJ [Anaerofustis stercorihominis]